MALRRYLCYGCDRQFGTMVNMTENNEVSTNNDIKCSACGSDFVEEVNSAQQANQAEQQMAQQQQQEQMSSFFQPNHQQQMPNAFQQQQVQLPMGGQMVTQTMTNSSSHGSQPGGYTRSVTISYGNGMDQPRVQTFTSNSGDQQMQGMPFPSVNFNNTNNIQMNMGRNPQDINQMLQGMFAGMPMFVIGGEGQQPQSRGCSDEYINNLPPMKEGADKDCNICLEKVGNEGNKSCELPCGHAFDKSCLSTWLKEHDSCPVCRSKLDQEREEAQPMNNPYQQAQQQQRNPFSGFFGF